MPSPLATFALAALLSLAPASHRSAPAGWEETPERYEERLHSIAADIASVSSSRHDVAALVGLAVEESGLRPDVDAGLCHAPYRCDGGPWWRPTAVGLWQLHPTSERQRAEITVSRVEGARVALARIRDAERRCGELGPELRYVGLLGRCATDAGSMRVAKRIAGMVTRAEQAR